MCPSAFQAKTGFARKKIEFRPIAVTSNLNVLAFHRSVMNV
jgi:hypothetical protein